MGDAIVVGTDGSDTAKRAVREAVRLAHALGASLHVVSAYEPVRGTHIRGAPDRAAETWAPRADAEVEGILGEAAAELGGDELAVETHALATDPADALLEVAEGVDATLIVVGSKGMHGARRFAIGNVPNKVSHKARCNVLIVATESPGED